MADFDPPADMDELPCLELGDRAPRPPPAFVRANVSDPLPRRPRRRHANDTVLARASRSPSDAPPGLSEPRAATEAAPSFASRVYTLAGITALILALSMGGRAFVRRMMVAVPESSVETYDFRSGMISLTGPEGMLPCLEEHTSPGSPHKGADCRFSRGAGIAVVVDSAPIPAGASVNLDAIVSAMRSHLDASLTVTREQWVDLDGQLIRKITGTLRESDGPYEYRAYVLVNHGHLIFVLVGGKDPVTSARSETMEAMLTSMTIRR